MNRLQQILFSSVLILSVLTSGCCLGPRKCDQGSLYARIKLVDASGKDLVFGPSRQFDPAQMKLYAVYGTDTVLQFIQGGRGPNPGDSFLHASFDYRQPGTVFLQLGNTDTDTLQLGYRVEDRSPCCDDVSFLASILYNNKGVEKLNGGIYIVRK